MTRLLAKVCGLAASVALVACRADSNTSGAHPLGFVSLELPASTERGALLALAHDAERRQHAYEEALRPGHLFAATRVEQRDIERGNWPASSLFELGAQLFTLEFRASDGFGARDLPPWARFQRGHRGGPDAYRCASCHWRGGPAGAGDVADDAWLDGDGIHPRAALARNPPSLHGAGFVELVAQELTARLSEQRDELVARARRSGRAERAPLLASGIDFGQLSAGPDGSVDSHEVRGVSSDLVVRPFGWKGNVATIRDAVEDELLLHHGMESTYLVKTASPERVGPFGGRDPDGDGVVGEIAEGQVTALTLFVAMQEVPVIEPPEEPELGRGWRAGRASFETLGCAHCHVPSLSIRSAVWRLPSRAGGPAVNVDLARDAAEPRLAHEAAGQLQVPLFSDLKRHDMGPELAEPRPDRGVPGNEFITPPLWGLAHSRPYLHDGRAPTLEEAILAHDGEARAARDAFAALEESQRAPLRIFLVSLTRARRIVVP